MNRRNFLGLLAGGLAASAAVRTFPFRAFSFPKEIKRADWQGLQIAPYPGRLCTPTFSPVFYSQSVTLPLDDAKWNDTQRKAFRRNLREFSDAFEDFAAKHPVELARYYGWREFTPDPSRGALPLGSAWPQG